VRVTTVPPAVSSPRFSRCREKPPPKPPPHHHRRPRRSFTGERHVQSTGKDVGGVRAMHAIRSDRYVGLWDIFSFPFFLHQRSAGRVVTSANRSNNCAMDNANVRGSNLPAVVKIPHNESLLLTQQERERESYRRIKTKHRDRSVCRLISFARFKEISLHK